MNALANLVGLGSAAQPVEIPDPSVTICMIDGHNKSDNWDLAESIVGKLNKNLKCICIHLTYTSLVKLTDSAEPEKMRDAILLQARRLGDTRRSSSVLDLISRPYKQRLLVVISDWGTLNQLAELSLAFGRNNIWYVRLELPRYISNEANIQSIGRKHPVFGTDIKSASVDSICGKDVSLHHYRMELHSDEHRWTLDASKILDSNFKPDVPLAYQIVYAYDKIAKSVADKFENPFGGCSSIW